MEPDYPVYWGPIIGMAEKYIRQGMSKDEVIARLERSRAYGNAARGSEGRIYDLANQFWAITLWMREQCHANAINDPACKRAIEEVSGIEMPYQSYGVKVQYTCPNAQGREVIGSVIVQMDRRRSVSQLLSRVAALLASGDLQPRHPSGAIGGDSISFGAGCSLSVHDVRGGGYGNDLDVGLGESLAPIKGVRESLIRQYEEMEGG